jgi:hypothetical protein
MRQLATHETPAHPPRREDFSADQLKVMSRRPDAEHGRGDSTNHRGEAIGEGLPPAATGRGAK